MSQSADNVTLISRHALKKHVLRFASPQCCAAPVN
jgi:hypothetical protein